MSRYKIAITIIFSLILSSANSANWSETELHIQHGKLTQPFGDNAGKKTNTLIFTFQHASEWEYGGNFFFFDHSSVSNNTELYSEWYPTFSSKRIFNLTYPKGLNDVNFVAGVNVAPESNILKYLPGIQIQWDVPGFSFLNTTLTAYIDDSKGLASNGAPKESNSAMFDIAWRYPVNIGQQKFSVEGHAEYISSRDTEIPNIKVKDWFLAQIQFRWDAGAAISLQEDQLFLGFEYQYWKNKLGTNENDNTAQLLAVWRF